jgi:hypothetical protein
VVPVLVLDVTEEEADVILATHDPLAAMAEADTDMLAELMGSIEMDSDAVQAMLEELAAEEGVFAAEEVGLPDLASGDKEPFQQMTFTLSDDQAGDVKRAMGAAKDSGPFVDTGNENGNGNALARIVEAYLGTC